MDLGELTDGQGYELKASRCDDRRPDAPGESGKAGFARRSVRLVPKAHAAGGSAASLARAVSLAAARKLRCSGLG